MFYCKYWLVFVLMLPLGESAERRINQEGRVLGDLPALTHSILFNSSEADAVLSAMQIFPLDNPWNEDISKRPLLSNSSAMISQIMTDLRSDRRTLRAFFEMNFVLVPDGQALVPIDFFNYGDQSDPSPYPIPSNLPVETWPRETGTLTLSDWQQDINGDGGDRHSILVMAGAGFIWETWLTRLVGNSWQASNGAKFDLKSNALRPAGWTSGDAGGLPMFPALVRYDECERGMVEHAMRLVVKRTRVGPIYPARHQASVGNLTDPNIPAMGQRVRLMAGFQIPAAWSKHEKAVLHGLKKYGAIVADNGNFFSISVTPDNRYPTDEFSHLSSISITNFEVIQTTGPAEGPRSPGAPVANAGIDRAANIGETIQLAGSVLFTNTTAALRTEWKQYSGPALAAFADVSKTNTTVALGSAGNYLFVLTADDGIHTPSYSAVQISATTPLNGVLLRAQRQGNNLVLSWTGARGTATIESNTQLSPTGWLAVTNSTSGSVILALPGGNMFYRLRL
jgi:hypothetical protein